MNWKPKWTAKRVLRTVEQGWTFGLVIAVMMSLLLLDCGSTVPGEILLLAPAYLIPRMMLVGLGDRGWWWSR